MNETMVIPVSFTADFWDALSAHDYTTAAELLKVGLTVTFDAKVCKAWVHVLEHHYEHNDE